MDSMRRDPVKVQEMWFSAKRIRQKIIFMKKNVKNKVGNPADARRTQLRWLKVRLNI